MTRCLDCQFWRSSRAARLRYNAAERLINVGTRMIRLSCRLNSLKFFVPGPTRSRQPMHSLAHVFLTQSAGMHMCSGSAEWHIWLLSSWWPFWQQWPQKWLNWRVNVWLCQHLPCQGFPIPPWDKSEAIRTLAIGMRKAVWFFHCWNIIIIIKLVNSVVFYSMSCSVTTHYLSICPDHEYVTMTWYQCKKIQLPERISGLRYSTQVDQTESWWNYIKKYTLAVTTLLQVQ